MRVLAIEDQPCTRIQGNSRGDHPNVPFTARSHSFNLIRRTSCAVSVSAAAVVVGGLAASVVEMIVVGNTHLSYRAFRLPWNQHWPSLFLAAHIR